MSIQTTGLMGQPLDTYCIYSKWNGHQLMGQNTGKSKSKVSELSTGLKKDPQHSTGIGPKGRDEEQDAALHHSSSAASAAVLLFSVGSIWGQAYVQLYFLHQTDRDQHTVQRSRCECLQETVHSTFMSNCALDAIQNQIIHAKSWLHEAFHLPLCRAKPFKQ